MNGEEPKTNKVVSPTKKNKTDTVTVEQYNSIVNSHNALVDLVTENLTPMLTDLKNTVAKLESRVKNKKSVTNGRKSDDLKATEIEA